MMEITAEHLQRGPARRSVSHAPFHARAQIAGTVLELRCDTPSLVAAFISYYRDHLTDEPAGFVFTVTRTDDGYAFDWDCGSYTWRGAALPADALMFLVDAAAVGELLDRDPSIVSFHGAAIAHAGHGAAIVAASNGGKTTTLLACARAGARVYSDERAIVRKRTLEPFLRTCSVRADGASRLIADCADDGLARWLRFAHRLSLVECFNEDVVAEPERLSLLFVIGGTGSRARIRPLSLGDGLRAIAPWYRAHGAPFDRLASAMSLLRTVDVVELTLGTPAESARVVLGQMEAMARAGI